MDPSEADKQGPTGWRWALVDRIVRKAGDLDVDVAEWLRGDTPLGIRKAIPRRGVFPATEPTRAQLESEEYLAARAGMYEVARNYPPCTSMRRSLGPN